MCSKEIRLKRWPEVRAPAATHIGDAPVPPDHEELDPKGLSVLLHADETVTREQIERVMAILDGGDRESDKPDDPEPYLTLKGAARRLGVSPCSLWRWKVPGHLLGGPTAVPARRDGGLPEQRRVPATGRGTQGRWAREEVVWTKVGGSLATRGHQDASGLSASVASESSHALFQAILYFPMVSTVEPTMSGAWILRIRW